MTKQKSMKNEYKHSEIMRYSAKLNMKGTSAGFEGDESFSKKSHGQNIIFLDVTNALQINLNTLMKLLDTIYIR